MHGGSDYHHAIHATANWLILSPLDMPTVMFLSPVMNAFSNAIQLKFYAVLKNVSHLRRRPRKSPRPRADCCETFLLTGGEETNMNWT